MSFLKCLMKKHPVTSKALSCTIHEDVAFKSRLLIPQRGYSESQDDRDKPIVFSTSSAARNPNLVITSTISEARKRDMPWYHPHVTLFSLACFLVYFMILREENDIDLILSGETVDYGEKIMNMQKEAMNKGMKKQ